MRTMTWPSGLEQRVSSPNTSCRVRPLPDTIRPCRPDVPAPAASTDHAVFPVHHVAACCVVGGAMWAGVITVGRMLIHVLAHLG